MRQDQINARLAMLEDLIARERDTQELEKLNEAYQQMLFTEPNEPPLADGNFEADRTSEF